MCWYNQAQACNYSNLGLRPALLSVKLTALLTVRACGMLKHRLQIAEFVFILGSFIGGAVALALGQIVYAVVPVAIALLLNLINRLRLEQQMKRRIAAAMTQLHRQVSEESYTQHQQQLQDAIATLKAQIPEYLAQLESPELQSSALQIIQFRGRLASLEQSLNSVVQYLNSASLLSRVDRLEEAIASATAEISRIYRQLPDTQQRPKDESESTLSTYLPENTSTSNLSAVSAFPVSTASSIPSIPEESPQVSPPPTTETLPVEKPQNISPAPPSWSFLRTLTGHLDWVGSLAMSSDGQILASGSYDKTIKLWQLPTGELIDTLSRHSKGVLCLAMSPDGQRLASGSFDEKIELWRLDTRESIKTLKGHTSSVRSLAISPDCQTLISGSFDETIKLWRLDTGELLGNLTQTAGQVSAIALSADGQTLASGGSDGIISLRLLDTEGDIQPSPALTLTGNLSSIGSLAISPDSEILAAGCSDGNVKLWQLGTLELLNVFQGHAGPILSVVFSSDASILLSGSADGTIRIWDVQSGQPLAVLSEDTGSSVMSVAVSPDGQFIASGGADSSITLWQRD